jgi:hypothetical protein
LEEVYDDYIVYRVEVNGGQEPEYYRRAYEVSQDDTIELATDSEKVKKKITYETLKKGIFNLFNNKKSEDVKMNKKEKPCCPEKVDQLISNKDTRFTEDDKEWLLELNEDALNKVIPVEKKEDPAVNEDGKAEITAEDVKKAISDYSTDEALELFPKEISDSIRSGLEANRQYREKLVSEICDNSNFKKEKLEKWETEDLKELHANVVKDVVDYSGNGGGGNLDDYRGTEADGVEPLYPHGVSLKQENK